MTKTDDRSDTRRGSDWLKTAGKAGHVAKGCVYIVIGVLATMAAVGAGGQAIGAKGAIHMIGRQPFGRILLGVLAVGLLAYVAWQMFQAIGDPDGKGNDAKGIAFRVAVFITGLAYFGLGLLAGAIAIGGGGGDGASRQEWTATLLSMPFGPWLVGLTGAVVAGVAVFNIYLAATQNFMNDYDRGQMSERAKKTVKAIGIFGLLSRAVTFAIIGGFLIVAGYQVDASETTGLSGALQILSEQAYGPWLLVVALGMGAYGVHCIVAAKFRHFPGLG